MKKVFLTGFLLFLCLYLHAQTITGKVYREGTDSVIAGATVYYGGSMAGAITDEQGRFELKARSAQVPVVVSCIGYNSGTVNYVPGKPLIVYLKPRQEQLHTVVIRADGMDRKEEVALFKRQFLGMSANALSCNIINIDDVDLFYDTRKETLTASCDKPLIIENKRLGYTISYYLDRFEWSPRNLYYAGNYIFSEKKSPDPQAEAKIKRNREDAYEGSRMQFIRALWNHSLKKTGFRIYTPYFDPLTEDSIITRDSLNQKYLHLKEKLFITYSSDARRVSPLIGAEKFAFIDKDGFYGEGLKWSGVFSGQRVGDLLPFEYQSEKEGKALASANLPDEKLAVKSSRAADDDPKDILLSDAERNYKIFKTMVLTPDNPLNGELVVKRWEHPVLYKIYGSSGNVKTDMEIAANTKELFGRLSQISGLEMREAGPADSANFSIMIGTFAKFKNVMKPGAVSFFRAHPNDSGYYTWSENGLSDMVQLVDVSKIAQYDLTWYQERAQIVSGLGFWGHMGKNMESLFFPGTNAWQAGKQPLDKLIIQALYSPKVKSGMNAAGLDSTIKNMFGAQPAGSGNQTTALPANIKFSPDADAGMIAAKRLGQLIFEKTWLHTDRDVYAKGDTIWFKAYLTDAQDNIPLTSGGNLHVELISPDAKIISSELIRLDKGSGNGDFELADTIPAGKYHLRAYTNWMRNFGENFIFDKEITILNTEAVPVAANPKTKSAKIIAAKIPAPAVTPVANTTTSTVRFYPEGGSLVEGVSSLVAVKAEDGFGKGIPVSGVVLSSAGDTITRFSTDTLGMGLLTLLPVKGQYYHAAMSGSLKSKTFDLPQALNNGLTLQIRQTDSVIRAIISTNNISAAQPSYVITVKHGGITVLSQHLQVTGQASVKIPVAGIPEGISAITLYDDQYKPHCERLVYIHHRGQSSISVIVNKKEYQAKEQVNVQINAKPNTSLSMAVVDAGVVPEQADDVVSYLMLGSELKGHIEQAHRYFDTTNVNRLKQLDLLLMTQGWRDFVWRRVADTAIHISYADENGVSVSGRLWDEARNKNLPNLNITLYANGNRGNRVDATKSDSAGRFNFTGLKIYGNQNIKLASVNDKGNKAGTFLMDTILAMPVKPLVTRNGIAETFSDSIARVAVQKKVTAMEKSNINGITKLKEVTIKANQNVILKSGPMTSWGPDQIFNITPADYKFKTLDWFLLQNTKGAFEPMIDPNSINPPPGESPRALTGVAYMGQDTFRYVIPTIGGSSGFRYRSKTKPLPPLLIVNGRELYMNEYAQAEVYRKTYFSMPLNKFKKIVLKRVTGILHGIGTPVQAETTPVDRYLLYLTLDEDAMTDNPGSKSVDVEGYYEARTFYQPPANFKPSINDFRTTTYWEPNIKTDAMGKATVSFYNGSAASAVRVLVQGISADGVPLSSIINYTVK